MALELLSGVTATNGKPSGATAGVPVSRRASGQLSDQGFQDHVVRAMLLVWSTAGSGTMEVEIRLWGYVKEYRKQEAVVAIAKWFPLGPGTDVLKGTFNQQVKAGETDANSITHEEIVAHFGTFDRLYAEVVTIAGTATAISAILYPLRSQEA